MKTLNSHTLLYDEDCPMCNIYTSGFIKSKMLDSNGRKPFPKITATEQNYIDVERAKNEIALVDNLNKKVFYGIDGLLKVIGNSFPIVEKIGNFKPVNFLLKKLYKFISYNRKVIAPSTVKTTDTFHCVPLFNIKYRTLYIVFSTLLTAVILWQYSKMIVFLPTATFLREVLLAVGQIGFQYIFIRQYSIQQQFNYLGNLVTVSIIGSLLLLPILLVNQFIILNPYFILAWFGLTVSVMILEHYRRVKILEMQKTLTFTWILYRIIALIIILNL